MRRIRRNDRNYCARRFDWSPAGDWPLTRQFGRKMNGIDEEDVARSPMVMSEPRGRPPWSHELGWSVKSVSCRMRARRSRRRCCRPAQLDSIHLPSKRGQSTQNVCTSLRFQVWISEIRRMRNWINGIARNTGTAVDVELSIDSLDDVVAWVVHKLRNIQIFHPSQLRVFLEFQLTLNQLASQLKVTLEQVKCVAMDKWEAVVL